VDSSAPVVYDDPVESVRNILEKINVSSPVRFDEPMSRHTSFEVGGPADIYVEPRTIDDLSTIAREVRRLELPLFPLGGGANILVSDAGIRGVVIDMRNFDELEILESAAAPSAGANGALIRAGAGLAISDVAAWCADQDLGGLDFLYAMPGSVGGAIWMNARCYGVSIDEVLREVDYVDEAGEPRTYRVDPTEFDYKKSPFQENPWIITSGVFAMRKEESREVWGRMEEHQEDRTGKGHFLAPSAGSVFKNNRSFGSPTGKIIDELGLRGYQIGGARVSDTHANIIVNTGTATATDIRRLIEYVESEVLARKGLELEREVLYAGEWSEAWGREAHI
jgi:UDP-N-acetylmuramate dehydrogenase